MVVCATKIFDIDPKRFVYEKREFCPRANFFKRYANAILLNRKPHANKKQKL